MAQLRLQRVNATVEIAEDSESLAELATERISAILKLAVADRGVAFLALAGGSTPERAYRRLAERNDIDWRRIKVFLSDERFVPLDHANSNFGMAARSLLNRANAPSANVFPIDVGAATAEEAASRYEASILLNVGDPPRFDLILLGLGEDGHTASLFPDAPSLAVTDRWVFASAPGSLPPPVERITFTFRTFNAAREVLFLVGGAKKAKVVREILEAGAAYPAASVQPTDGNLTWLLDVDAAGLLTSAKRP